MLERFAGDDGNRRLTEALCRQLIVQGSVHLASALAASCEVSGIGAGGVLIEQGSSDNDLFFILAGAFAVLVNGREVTRRNAGQAVGEMALIDPSEKWPATVVALEESVVARISEAEFADLASEHPNLWKNIAVVLADRLRQRNELVRRRNELPYVFVGSSKESLDVADAIQAGLGHDPFIVTVWTNGVFGPSEFAIEGLERVAAESDFAVLVLGPDDRVISRAHESLSPRDNVVLELGLFIGAAEHRRVFLLVPKGVDVKIPTDVLGVTPISYSTNDSIPLATRLEPACSALRRAISELGPR